MKQVLDIASAWLRCELCPRRCGVNRQKGERGWCGASDKVRLYAWQSHPGEEPPVSGLRGSGTMFFSHCTLGCLYCQNYPWSQLDQGEDFTIDELVAVFRSLSQAGCHNWNWVSPTPWLPALIKVLDLMSLCGDHLLPVVYNTSGYERVETLRALAGHVAVYLADLRYANNQTAIEASDCSDYVEHARAALLEMWRQVGPLREQDGVAVSGLIVRILVLPGHADEARANLEWMAEHFGETVAVSIMAQYTPAHLAHGRTPWGRPVTRAEYEMVCRKAEDCGLNKGWIQSYDEMAPGRLAGFNMPQCSKHKALIQAGGNHERT